MSFTPVDELPSRTIPQRGVLCPEDVIRAARARNDIDVDVVWDCDPPMDPRSALVTQHRGIDLGYGEVTAPSWPGGIPIACWLVLERCEDPSRWATVNGQLARGYRAAYYHRDHKTQEPLDPRTIPEAIAERDQGVHAQGDAEDVERYIDRAAEASRKRQETAQAAVIDGAVQKGREAAADRWGTLVRTPDLIAKHARHLERQAARARDTRSANRFGVVV